MQATNTQVDTRAYGMSVTLTKLANTLTAASNVNLPAHTRRCDTGDTQGAADTKKLVVTLPHGLSGSLASIPSAQRCSLAKATLAPVRQARIATGTGTVVTTDSATPVAVTGRAT